MYSSCFIRSLRVELCTTSCGHIHSFSKHTPDPIYPSLLTQLCIICIRKKASRPMYTVQIFLKVWSYSGTALLRDTLSQQLLMDNKVSRFRVSFCAQFPSQCWALVCLGFVQALYMNMQCVHTCMCSCPAVPSKCFLYSSTNCGPYSLPTPSSALIAKLWNGMMEYMESLWDWTFCRLLWSGL